MVFSRIFSDSTRNTGIVIFFLFQEILNLRLKFSFGKKFIYFNNMDYYQKIVSFDKNIWKFYS